MAQARHAARVDQFQFNTNEAGASTPFTRHALSMAVFALRLSQLI